MQRHPVGRIGDPGILPGLQQVLSHLITGGRLDFSFLFFLTVFLRHRQLGGVFCIKTLLCSRQSSVFLTLGRGGGSVR